MNAMNSANGAIRKSGVRYDFPPGGKSYLTPLFSLRIDQPQRESLADGLRAVQHVEFAQGLLDVVLDGERADVQDHPDFDVALAVVDPLQDLRLARGEEPGLGGLVGAGAIERPRHLAADPRGVQVRHDQVGEVGLLWADGARPAGEDVEARYCSGGGVRAVREPVARAQPRKLARQGGAGQRPALGLAEHGLAAVLLPHLDQVRDERNVLLERLVQARALDWRGREAVDPHGALP